MMSSFREQRIELEEAEIYLRSGGSGPPLLLLHGYPQTHVAWHAVAPMLARDFTLVMPDLRGYGQSRGPAPDPDHRNHAKRAMARDMVALMASLGHERFLLAGHDRGGRVGYRLCLDHSQRVERFAALAAAVHLCGFTPTDLSDPAQRRQAVLRYNQSERYADEVLGWAEQYAEQYGDEVPAGQG